MLFLVLHASSVDRRSADLVGRDFAVACAARETGRQPVWEVLPVQSTDWAVWRSTLLGAVDDPGSLAAGQLAYWRTTLAGLPVELALPAGPAACRTAELPRRYRPARAAGGTGRAAACRRQAAQGDVPDAVAGGTRDAAHPADEKLRHPHRHRVGWPR